MSAIPDMSSQWDDLVKKDPDYKPAGILDMTGEMLLERCGGREMHYFEDIDEMKDYLIKNVHYQPEQFVTLKIEDMTPPLLLFIDKNAQKFAMHLSYGFTPCIADPSNPYYDATIARREAIEMFWNDDCVSTEALLWLLDHDYLPDIYGDEMFSQRSTKEEKQADAHFLLRYMRKENY